MEYQRSKINCSAAAKYLNFIELLEEHHLSFKQIPDKLQGERRSEWVDQIGDPGQQPSS